MTAKKSLGGMGNLSSLLNQNADKAGTPLQLPVEKVKLDPANIRNHGDDRDKQERQDFIEKELGPDVKERGVKQPISVRSDPDEPGSYIINAGEGRYLATVWAALPTIPAFIDEDFTDFDNAKENTKRLGLSGRQLARFIKKKEGEGLSKKEIAQGLGISPSLVNQLSNLLKMPQCIEEVYEAGRLRDLTTIAELMTIYKTFPKEVEDWLTEQADEILRSAVKKLRVELEEPQQPEENNDGRMREERGAPGAGVQDPKRDGEGGGEGGGERDPNTIDFLNGEPDSSLNAAGGNGGEETGDGAENDGAGASSTTKDKNPPEVDPEKFKKAIIQVQHDGRPARLILDRRPPAIGWAWVKYDDDGHEFEADLNTVQLVALVEG
jgi:ParB family chromosome partitioning protein